MEMLVVVAIIVALAGMGGYMYIRQMEQSKISLARTHVKTTLTTAVKTYYLDHGEYPPSLDVLMQETDGKGPYLESLEALIDPWKQAYQYDPTGPNNGGMKPDIWAASAAGLIGNWDIQR
jgi:type II secretory pathway pseudopilin PulG